MSERLNASSGSPYEPVIGFSRAVRVGERVLVAGTAPVWSHIPTCGRNPHARNRRPRSGRGRLGDANAATTLNVYANFLDVSDRDAAEALGRLLDDTRRSAR